VEDTDERRKKEKREAANKECHVTQLPHESLQRVKFHKRRILLNNQYD
jgi:hypothetical protein